MSSLPQRAPRVHLAGTTPAVLRFPDGRRASGKLQVVSLTGGLLSLSSPVVQGSQVKLMFVTRAGSVLGGAEMLSPLSSDLQPFRFISLAAGDQRRLGATIPASPHQQLEEQWIEKFRAASANRQQPRKLLFRLVGALGLFGLALASTIYLFQFHWLK
jgi:hypothetical protein